MRDYSKITKPTPEKYCEYCGKKLERRRYTKKWEDLGCFKRRKYCDQECMRKAFVGARKDKQHWGAAHGTARKLVYLIGEKGKVCEICGSTKNVDIHHKDGDFRNNSTSNLMLVCRSCHNKIHQPKQVCVICGAPMKGHGYCNKHYIRYKKYGTPYMYYHKVQHN